MNDETTSKNRNTTDFLLSIYGKLNQEEKRFIFALLADDPLKDVYRKIMLAYLLIMGVTLLWPFDFALFQWNNAQWNRDSPGIFFPDESQLISDGPARSLFEKIQEGSGLSIEVWIETESVVQTGPARIVSYSLNPHLRNFTLGQSFDQLVFRLRTTETNLNGTKPHLVVNDVFMDRGMLHIVVTYDFSEQLAYVNGELRKKTSFLKGDFSNWDSSHKLVFGNEASGNRPWLGKIFYAAIYNRSLDGLEVQRHYEFGLKRDKIKETINSDALHGTAAKYLFDEERGDRILDRASSSKALHLTLPEFISRKGKPFLSLPDSLFSNRHIDHFIMNVMIFFPLGFLVHATFRNRYGNAKWISVIAAVAGICFSFAAETLQYFSLTRDSSSLDAAANSLGMITGVICDRIYAYYLQRRAVYLSAVD